MEQPEKTTENLREIVVSSVELAAGIGVTRKSIKDFVLEGMPQLVESSGRRPATFDLWAVLRWLRNRWKRGGAIDETAAMEYERRKRDCDLRMREAEAEIKERQSALESGRLVEREVLQSQFRLILQRFQMQMEGLAAQVSGVVPADIVNEVHSSVTAIVRERFNTALTEAKKILPPIPAELKKEISTTAKSTTPD